MLVKLSIEVVWILLIVCHGTIGEDITLPESVTSEAGYSDLFESAGYPTVGDIPLLNRKIFKGMRVTVQEHPYVISVRRMFSHYITGTLLTKKLAITVAHPLLNVPNYELGIVAGETYSDRGTTLRSVVIVIIHEDFDPYTLTADLALLRLYEEFVFKISVKPIPMIAPSSTLSDARAFVTGWGRCDLTGKELCLPRSTSFFPNEKIDPMMRTISFVITLPNYYCGGYERLETPVKPGMICLGIAREENAVAPCLAVPGAPLVISGRLAGIQSWGFGCGYHNDLPLVYTDLRVYQPWLLHNIPILRNLTQNNLTELFQATKAYALYKLLSLTRGNVEPLSSMYIDKPIIKTDLDSELAKLRGSFYDIRDFIYSGALHPLKMDMVQSIRNDSNDVQFNKSRVLLKSVTTKPFLNENVLKNDEYSENEPSLDIINSTYLEDNKNFLPGNTNDSDSDDNKSELNFINLEENYS